ncbi:MAG: prepilin-type N-terminal cleavage/methylation domain-containing protein [Halothiobacillus sp.]|jgi:type IV pilus assembly protein PilE|nr:prepilin-type N-terminal cleavage/methylation domain-containing protein [Halothiobacillus sp.]
MHFVHPVTAKNSGTNRKCLGQVSARGFTLIELMIVVAIIAIIAAIAYPSYISSVVKSHRASAEGCLAEHASFMERYYATNLGYDKDTNNLAIGGAGGPVLPPLGCDTQGGMAANYAFSFTTAPTATTYSIRAVPQGAQAPRDTRCGTLNLDQTGARTFSGTGTVAECW